jgi:hypothetical protein
MMGTVGLPLPGVDLRLEAVPELGYLPSDKKAPRGEVSVGGFIHCFNPNVHAAQRQSAIRGRVQARHLSSDTQTHTSEAGVSRGMHCLELWTCTLLESASLCSADSRLRLIRPRSSCMRRSDDVLRHCRQLHDHPVLCFLLSCGSGPQGVSVSCCPLHRFACEDRPCLMATTSSQR